MAAAPGAATGERRRRRDHDGAAVAPGVRSPDPPGGSPGRRNRGGRHDDLLDPRGRPGPGRYPDAGTGHRSGYGDGPGAGCGAGATPRGVGGRGWRSDHHDGHGGRRPGWGAAAQVGPRGPARDHDVLARDPGHPASGRRRRRPALGPAVRRHRRARPCRHPGRRRHDPRHHSRRGVPLPNRVRSRRPGGVDRAG